MSRLLHVAAVDFTGVKLLGPQLEALTRQGFDVRLACGRTDEAHWAALKPFRPADIAFPRKSSPRATLIALARLWRLVRQWRPDVLHLHTPAASLPVRLLPRIVWPSDPRIVYTVHGYLHPWPPRTRVDRVVQQVERLEARWTDMMLFQSEEDLCESQSRRYATRMAYLGNGVEDAWFNLQPPRRHGAWLRVLYVGRLVREKGVLDLVRALRGLPGVRLELVGAALPSDRDPIEQELNVLLADPDLAGRVLRLGSVDKDRVRQSCAEADVICLPSYREGVPRSVIEGLAAGRPAVVTDIRGCRELVKDGVNGFLFTAGDITALRDRLAALAVMKATRFGALSAAARSSADPRWREQAVFERLIAAYAELGVQAR